MGGMDKNPRKVVGKVKYMLDGKEIGSVDVVVCDDVERIGYYTLIFRAFSRFFLK